MAQVTFLPLHLDLHCQGETFSILFVLQVSRKWLKNSQMVTDRASIATGQALPLGQHCHWASIAIAITEYPIRSFDLKFYVCMKSYLLSICKFTIGYWSILNISKMVTQREK